MVFTLFFNAEIMTSKRELFIWKKHHESLLLNEILLEEPFKFNNGSKEKGAVWSKIAESLAQHGMKVTQRSVREKFEKLYSEFKEREREEKQASGVDVEYDENYRALTEIHERISEYEEERQVKETKEKATAAEMRKRATERLSLTKKRNKADTAGSDESEEEVSPKRRKSQTSMVDMIKESVAMKQKYQDDQSQIRSRELELRAAELQQQQQFQSMLIQQQQQFQQQQQQMTMAMFTTLNELFKKIKN